MMPNWYSSAIVRGDQTGSRYVYPTINLDPSILSESIERGVYASLVKLADKTYQGALYFGPRVVKAETNDVLEVYLLDFAGETKVQSVNFTLAKHLRGVMDFPTLEDLRTQVTKDVEAVRKALDET